MREIDISNSSCRKGTTPRALALPPDLSLERGGPGIALGRAETPEVVAALVSFLAGPDWMT